MGTEQEIGKDLILLRQKNQVFLLHMFCGMEADESYFPF